MWHAIASSTGKPVHAEAASRNRAYRCPVCDGEVFLRRGQHYASHFAHRHDTAKPECELYTPGDGQPQRHDPQGDAGNWKTHEPPRIPPASVSIEVEALQPRMRERLPRWNLCITIPRSPDGRGSITFGLGSRLNRQITLGKLAGGSITYPADPDARCFTAVSCSPDTHFAYREAITQRQPGLNRLGMSFFSSDPRRYKPRVNRLVWGRAYYFVWRTPYNPNFPESFERRRLADNNHWSCALGLLPDSGDEALSEWLKKVCLVDVESPSSTWSLLYPSLSRCGYDGRIEVPALGNLIVGCRRLGKRTVSCVVSGQPAHLQLPDVSSSIVALTHSTDTPDTLELSGAHGVSFRFGSLRTTERPPDPMVWCDFDSPIQGSLRVPMHSVAARRCLREVRLGRAQLERITLPEALQGELAWSTIPGQWNRTWLNRPDGRVRRGLHPVKLPREELDQVQDVLRSTAAEVRVSFFGFGDHHFPPEERNDTNAPLPRSLRARMRWLQSEVSLLYAGGPSAEASVSQHSEQDLIDRFLALTPPASLVGHYHSICSSIRRHLGSTEVL